MDKYGMHLMVLSHVYRVKWLKDFCEVELALRLTVDSVIDVLQLARQCDVPRLYLQCMRLLYKEFAAVQKTEAWLFLQNNDPWFELEILKFMEEEDMVCEKVSEIIFEISVQYCMSPGRKHSDDGRSINYGQQTKFHNYLIP